MSKGDGTFQSTPSRPEALYDLCDSSTLAPVDTASVGHLALDLIAKILLPRHDSSPLLCNLCNLVQQKVSSSILQVFFDLALFTARIRCTKVLELHHILRLDLYTPEFNDILDMTHWLFWLADVPPLSKDARSSLSTPPSVSAEPCIMDQALCV